MRRSRSPRRPHTPSLHNVLIGAAAVLCAAARVAPTHDTPGPVMRAATAFVRAAPARGDSAAAPTTVSSVLARETGAALAALGAGVGPLSHPQALENAFRSYFAYHAAHPEAATKPYLYFVDYGLPSTTPRGYVFDMAALRVVDGPFMVAHGRGSSSGDGVPSRFSNATGSASTSLGLYLAQELYAFRGKSAGHAYASIGMRLAGVSAGYNDNARSRGVVAHGAPYVTPTRAGRSEGCPALEPDRAERILPKLANGGLVFLFAPDARWMANDPWVAGRAG